MQKNHPLVLQRKMLGIAAAIVIMSAAAYAAAKPVSDAYPLSTCAVCGTKLSHSKSKPVEFNYKGREIRVCCKKCEAEFKKDPAKYLAKVNAAIIAQQMPYYPTTKCVVTGKPVGNVNYVYKNRLIRFCSKQCIKTFKADPAKYLAKLDQDVIAKQMASYPLTTCVCSGNKLEKGKAVNYVYGDRLIRFCSKGCIASFNKNPQKYLAKLDAASKKSGTATK